MSFYNYNKPVMNEILKQKLRKLDTDSNSYSHIDEKCCFCNVKIKKSDVIYPNTVFEAGKNGQEFVSHHDCLSYVLQKYPNVPISDLHGKVSRIYLDGCNVRF